MTPEEALAAIQRLSAQGHLRIEGDANWSVGASGTNWEGVQHAIATATDCTASGPYWHLRGGLDDEGRAWRVVVDLCGDLVYVEAVR